MGKQQLIYVIEDSSIIREVVSLIFSGKKNSTVKAYCTGEEMFLNMNDEIPNLLILDYYLNAKNKNAMNGYDVLKKLNDNHKKVTTILLSGMHDEKKLKEVKELGVVDFINKEVDDVFTKIESLSSKYLLD
ncbi:MAG: response regulator [Flavobacteriales bacterium]|nr:response regulator [Flavobacteriales bacterium]